MVTVSVIIPTLNRADVISRAIRSVLSQTYCDFELIIVDDSPNDSTQKIVKKFNDPRVRYVKNLISRGANTARNVGIKIAEGEYIAFLDDDDEWLPSKLLKQVNMISKSSESVGAIYTGFKIINGKKDIKVVKPLHQGYIFKKLLAGNCVGTTSTVLVRRRVFDEVSGFDEKLPALQDWDMWLRIAEGYEFRCISEPLVNYYRLKESISKNVQKQIRGFIMFFNKYREHLSLDKLKSLYYLRVGELLCLNGDMGTGKNYILRALLYDLKNFNCILHIFLSLFGHSMFTKFHGIMEDTSLPYIIREFHL